MICHIHIVPISNILLINSTPPVYIAVIAQRIESQTKSRADDWGCAFECRSRQNVYQKTDYKPIIYI